MEAIDGDIKRWYQKKIDISSHLVFVVKLNCFKRPILKGKNNPVMSLEKKERKKERTKA